MVKPFKFRALLTLEDASHGGIEADLPINAGRLIIRGHSRNTVLSKAFTAVLRSDDYEPLHAGDRFRVVTLTVDDALAADFLMPGGRFELWQGHDLGHGTITRRVFI